MKHAMKAKQCIFHNCFCYDEQDRQVLAHPRVLVLPSTKFCSGILFVVLSVPLLFSELLI